MPDLRSGRKINGNKHGTKHDHRPEIRLKKYQTAKNAKTKLHGISVSLNSPTTFSFLVRKYARKTGSAIFASSDG